MTIYFLRIILRIAEEMGIKINMEKTKYMKMSRKCSGTDEIKMNGKNIEKVSTHINPYEVV